MLTSSQIDAFLAEGFVRLDDAFPPQLAAAARAVFWKDLREQGVFPDDPRTWTRPVVRLGMYAQQHIAGAADSDMLRAACNQLVGAGQWRPCRAIGTVPVRFPSTQDPGDTGWHIDAGFGDDPQDFMAWRANIHSRGRALLMLMLFSDTGGRDAPTRIRVGSHRDIAAALAPAGQAGLSLRELVPHVAATSGRREILATGAAGTVYLCHPFLVHAAQMHRGASPRFLAQPPLLPVRDDWLAGIDRAGCPVAAAIA